MRDAIVFVDNALIGAGLRDRVKVAALGKIVSAYDIVRVCALGADWCNMARPFMFSIDVSKLDVGALSHRCSNNGSKRYRVIDRRTS